MKILSNVICFLLGGFVFFLATPEPKKISQPQPVVEAVQKSEVLKPKPVVPVMKTAKEGEDAAPLSLNAILQKSDPSDKLKSIIKLIEECPSGEIGKLTENIIDLHNDGRIDKLMLGSAFLFLGKRPEETIQKLILSNELLLKYSTGAVASYMSSLSAKNPTNALQLISRYKIKSDRIIHEIYKSCPVAQVEVIKKGLAELGFSKTQLSGLEQIRKINQQGYYLYTGTLLKNEDNVKHNKALTNGDLILSGSPLSDLNDAAAGTGAGSLMKIADSISETAGADPYFNARMAASISSLARMDLDAAMKWTQNAKHTPARSVGLSMIVSEAIRQNPDRALEFVKEFPDAQGEDKLNMLLGLESGLQETTKLSAEEKEDLLNQTRQLIKKAEQK